MEDHVDHPKLRQLLQYTLVFLGGSPATTPALSNIMTHVDLNLDVDYPAGGMGAAVDDLVRYSEEAVQNVDVLPDAGG